MGQTEASADSAHAVVLGALTVQVSEASRIVIGKYRLAPVAEWQEARSRRNTSSGKHVGATGKTALVEILHDKGLGRNGLHDPFVVGGVVVELMAEFAVRSLIFPRGNDVVVDDVAASAHLDSTVANDIRMRRHSLERFD